MAPCSVIRGHGVWLYHALSLHHFVLSYDHTHIMVQVFADLSNFDVMITIMNSPPRPAMTHFMTAMITVRASAQ